MPLLQVAVWRPVAQACLIGVCSTCSIDADIACAAAGSTTCALPTESLEHTLWLCRRIMCTRVAILLAALTLRAAAQAADTLWLPHLPIEAAQAHANPHDALRGRDMRCIHSTPHLAGCLMKDLYYDRKAKTFLFFGRKIDDSDEDRHASSEDIERRFREHMCVQAASRSLRWRSDPMWPMPQSGRQVSHVQDENRRRCNRVEQHHILVVITATAAPLEDLPCDRADTPAAGVEDWHSFNRSSPARQLPAAGSGAIAVWAHGGIVRMGGVAAFHGVERERAHTRAA